MMGTICEYRALTQNSSCLAFAVTYFDVWRFRHDAD